MRRVDQGDSVRVPLLWIAVLVSLLLHGGLLALRWQVPDKPVPPAPEGQGKGALKGRIQAQVPPSRPAVREQPPAVASRPPPAERRPAQKAPRPPVAKAPPAVPEVLLRPAPDPSRQVIPSPSAPSAEPAAPPQGDFSAFVRSNQERREGPRPSVPAPTSEPAPEDENARRDRAVMANLGSLQPRMVGETNQQGGGIFQIREMGIEYATFYFYGWNKEMRRKNTQSVEVARGSNPSMALAVVRRMIAIIREHEKEDFVWESLRLRRDVTLSARPRDNAQLEAFLMADFFRQ